MVDLRERRAAFDTFFETCAPRLDDPERLRDSVGRALARQALWRASRAFDTGRVEGDGALPVDELVAFALDVFPEARRLREWRGLRVRRSIGAGRSGWFPPFVATGSAHRLRSHADRLRMETRGT